MAEIVGECILQNKDLHKKLWKIHWLYPKSEIKKDNARIYFIVVNDQIMKIGASESKGGIVSTFSFYENSLRGSPSLRSFGVHYLITNELMDNNKVQISCKWYDKVKLETPILGLLTNKINYVYPSIKQIEKLHINEFYDIYGFYPEWNFQEQGKMFPKYIRDLYKLQVQSRG